MSAQELASKFQVGLQLGLAQVSERTLDPEGPDPTGAMEGSAALGTAAGPLKSTTTSTEWGTLQTGSITLGYSFTEHILVGFDVHVRKDHMQVADVSTADPMRGVEASTLSIELAPKIEYSFSGSVVRPFAGSQLGLASALSEGNNSAITDVSMLVLAPRIAAGLHWFLTPSVSLTPSVFGSVLVGSATLTFARNEHDASLSGFVFGLQAGLFAWI